MQLLPKKSLGATFTHANTARTAKIPTLRGPHCVDSSNYVAHVSYDRTLQSLVDKIAKTVQAASAAVEEAAEIQDVPDGSDATPGV